MGGRVLDMSYLLLSESQRIHPTLYRTLLLYIVVVKYRNTTLHTSIRVISSLSLERMGSIIGITGAKEPPFTVIYPAHGSSIPKTYEIRRYPMIFVAEVSMKEEGMNQAFRKLANYIGAFGSPQNHLGTVS